jgi:hypothetical protein
VSDAGQSLPRAQQDFGTEPYPQDLPKLLIGRVLSMADFGIGDPHAALPSRESPECGHRLIVFLLRYACGPKDDHEPFILGLVIRAVCHEPELTWRSGYLLFCRPSVAGIEGEVPMLPVRAVYDRREFPTIALGLLGDDSNSRSSQRKL